MAISFAFAVTLLIATGHSLPAQVVIGVRYGHAEGTANYSVGEVNARAHVTGPVYASATFAVIGGIWACAESPANAVRCGYDGYSVAIGPALGLHDSDRLFLALRGAIGGFVRTGAYGGREYEGDRKLTGSLGLDGEIRVAGPVRLQLGVAHHRIFDGTYENLVGEFPNFTACIAGVSFAFK